MRRDEYDGFGAGVVVTLAGMALIIFYLLKMTAKVPRAFWP